MSHYVWTCLSCGKSGGEEGIDGEDAEIACHATHSGDNPGCDDEPLTFDSAAIARDYGMLDDAGRRAG